MNIMDYAAVSYTTLNFDPVNAPQQPVCMADAWHGARIQYRARELAHQATSLRAFGEIDIGEPSAPKISMLILAVIVLVTGQEFARFGASPSVLQLDQAGGLSAVALHRGAIDHIVTANFLHANLMHLGFNVFIIFLVGRWLEHLAGRLVVAATLAASILLSSIGALLTAPLVVTIGASGMAFGLVGCGVAIDPKARTATGSIARSLLIVNIIATFLIPGISIGGHLGGLTAGLLVGALSWRDRSESHIGNARIVAPLAVATICVLIIGALLMLPHVDPAFGLDIGRALATTFV